MSVARPEPPRLTFEEWLKFEEFSEVRHELIDGVPRAMNDVFAMSGGTNRHNRAAGLVYRSIVDAFEEQGCRVYVQGEALQVSATQAYYPDVFTTCGPEVGDRYENDARWVVEVLSPTTRVLDEGRKSEEYLALPSVQGYVLVDTEARYVELRTPVGGDLPRWNSEVLPAGHGHRVDLGPVELDVDALFERLDKLSPPR